ncbi:MAG: helix-turn-helix transcriptional regulator [bacterium]
MNAKEAVAKRIQELCKKKNIALNTLANDSGVSPSTLYSIINEKSKNPGVVTIQKLCDGLGISVHEFFNSSVFKNLEQIIF